MGQFGAHTHISPTVSALAGIFAKMSTIYNPFIYGITHPRFKKKLQSAVSNITTWTYRGSSINTSFTRSFRTGYSKTSKGEIEMTSLKQSNEYRRNEKIGSEMNNDFDNSTTDVKNIKETVKDQGANELLLPEEHSTNVSEEDST